jgi:hypothetical protein
MPVSNDVRRPWGTVTAGRSANVRAEHSSLSQKNRRTSNRITTR